jgi:hypothetical protein
MLKIYNFIIQILGPTLYSAPGPQILGDAPSSYATPITPSAGVTDSTALSATEV